MKQNYLFLIMILRAGHAVFAMEEDWNENAKKIRDTVDMAGKIEIADPKKALKLYAEAINIKLPDIDPILGDLFQLARASQQTAEQKMKALIKPILNQAQELAKKNEYQKALAALDDILNVIPAKNQQDVRKLKGKIENERFEWEQDQLAKVQELIKAADYDQAYKILTMLEEKGISEATEIKKKIEEKKQITAAAVTLARVAVASEALKKAERLAEAGKYNEAQPILETLKTQQISQEIANQAVQLETRIKEKQKAEIERQKQAQEAERVRQEQEAERQRLAAEEQARQAQERQAQERQAQEAAAQQREQQERERQEREAEEARQREEQERQEAERQRLAAEEQARQEAEQQRLAQEAAQQREGQEQNLKNALFNLTNTLKSITKILSSIQVPPEITYPTEPKLLPELTRKPSKPGGRKPPTKGATIPVKAEQSTPLEGSAAVISKALEDAYDAIVNKKATKTYANVVYYLKQNQLYPKNLTMNEEKELATRIRELVSAD